MQQQKSTDQQIIEMYQADVSGKYPDRVPGWPVISGYNLKAASFGEWQIYVFIHTGNALMKTRSGIGELPSSVIGFPTIDATTKARVRERIARHFRLGSKAFSFKKVFTDQVVGK